MAEPNRNCQRCGKKHLSRFVWLELNNRTNIYSEPGTVPAKESQGLFPFGLMCAAKELQRGKHPATIKRWTIEGRPSCQAPDQIRSSSRWRRDPMSDFTEYDVTEAMVQYGGAFVAGLGRLYRAGDAENRAKLRAAFPEYWEQYRELALLRGQQPEGTR